MHVYDAVELAAWLNTEIVKCLSGHSIRVGAAQDLMADGFGLLPIIRVGGWKTSNTVGRYVEQAEIALLGKLRHSIDSGVSQRHLKTDPPFGSA